MSSSFARTVLGPTAVVALLFSAAAASAATFQTFVDDEPGFQAALGSATVVRSENFATAVDQAQVAAAGASGDVWNGFTINKFGSGGQLGGSRYCTDLGGPNCVNWNPTTPRVPGLFGDMAPNAGVSIKPTVSTTAGMSFSFVDWNDGAQKSALTILASDGTSTVVTGPTNPDGAPPKTFGVVLSQADLAAGRYITELRWLGIPAQPQSEAVGFYNFRSFSNSRLESTTPRAVPSLQAWAVMILGGLLALIAVTRLPRRR